MHDTVKIMGRKFAAPLVCGTLLATPSAYGDYEGVKQGNYEVEGSYAFTASAATDANGKIKHTVRRIKKQ